MPDKRDLHKAKSKRGNHKSGNKPSRSAATTTMTAPAAAQTNQETKAANQARKGR